MKTYKILEEFNKLSAVNREYNYILVIDKILGVINGYDIEDTVINIVKRFEEKEKTIYKFSVIVENKNFNGAWFDRIKIKINNQLVVIADPLFFTKNELIRAALISITKNEIEDYLNWIGKKDIKQLTKSELINLIE